MNVKMRIEVRDLQEFQPIDIDKAGCASREFVGHYESGSTAKREGRRYE
jgi:hypothetical protein